MGRDPVEDYRTIRRELEAFAPELAAKREIVALNKIDLPGADPERIKEEIEAIIGLDCSKEIACSAKTGLGVPQILQALKTSSWNQH